METKQPLLSICIPTYNRANVLEDNLNSLVKLDGFSDDVEVIISDNCSTDETQRIGESFAQRYSNIRYYRNESNVGGCQNILLSLERGSGHFLKLVNDYTFFYKDGISFLLKLIQDNLSERPVFYFHYEYGDAKPETITVKDVNEVVLREGCKLGWLSCFGYWKNDFLALNNRNRKFESLFPQLDWFFRSCANKNKVIYCQKKIFLRKDLTEKYKLVKEDYNYIEVHGINYIKLLKDFVKEGVLDQKIIEPVKKTLMYPLVYTIALIKFAHQKNHSYKIDNAKAILKSEYAIYPWYHRVLAKSIVRAVAVISIQRILGLSHLDKFFDIEKIFLAVRKIF